MADDRDDVRARAEELLRRGQPRLDQAEPSDLAALVHELQVHHLELEMQNEELRRTQRDLEQSRDRYMELYDLAPVGYVTLDADGRILEANLTVTSILGHPRTLLRGMLLRDLVTRNDLGPFHRHRHVVITDRTKETCELRMRRADGVAVWIRMVSQPARDGDELRVTLSDITPLKKAEEELRILTDTLEERVAERAAEAAMKSEQLRALAHELTTTEIRERRRLAELIHDSLKQEVAGARMLLATVVPHVAAEEAADTLRQVDQVLTDAIRTCRNLNEELFPAVLRGAGLVPALQWLATRFEERHGLTAEVRATTDLEPARDEVAALLFRSVRELLYNVVKYAEVDRAVVEVASPEDDLLELAVEDRGKGFDPAILDQPTVTGFGLFAVRERLEMLGGTIEIQSIPDDGARITLRCPVDATAARPTDPSTAWAPSDATGPVAASADPTPGPRPWRVLVADDHLVMREGLVTLLEDLPDVEIVGVARDGAEAVRKAAELRPDVVLMDVSMPVKDGIEATLEITRALPETRVVGLSMHADEETERRMLRAGAVRYLVKETPAEELIRAIRESVSSRPRPAAVTPTPQTSADRRAPRTGSGRSGQHQRRR